MIGQAEVPAPTAAVIYTLEPVWASLLAMIVFGDSFGWRAWLGAALISCAAVASTRAPSSDGEQRRAQAAGGQCGDRPGDLIESDTGA